MTINHSFEIEITYKARTADQRCECGCTLRMHRGACRTTGCDCQTFRKGVDLMAQIQAMPRDEAKRITCEFHRSGTGWCACQW